MIGDEMRMTVLTGGAFRIGTVLSTSLRLMRRNIVLFTAIAGLAYAPELLIGAISEEVDFETADAGVLLRALLPSEITTAIMSTLSTAIIVHLVLHQAIGRPVRVGEAIAATLSWLSSLIAVALLSRLALILPLLLIFTSLAFLLVLSAMNIFVAALIFSTPSLILLTMWYVVIPVCVMERRGPFQSVSRSNALTKGARAKLLVFLILEFALAYIAGNFAPNAVSAFTGYWGQIAVQFALVSLYYAFTGVLTAVIYYELLTEKQGFAPEQIAAVFD
jgi:hypothetical protein